MLCASEGDSTSALSFTPSSPTSRSPTFPLPYFTVSSVWKQGIDEGDTCFTTHRKWGEGVLGAGSIPVEIHATCQNMKPIALQLHKRDCSWVVKIRNTLEGVLSSQ